MFPGNRSCGFSVWMQPSVIVGWASVGIWAADTSGSETILFFVYSTKLLPQLLVIVIALGFTGKERMLHHCNRVRRFCKYNLLDIFPVIWAIRLCATAAMGFQTILGG